MDVPVADDLALVLQRPAADGGGPPGARGVRARRPRSRCASIGWPLAVAEAEPLAEPTALRTALLAAVSHDLRTPLASAKAAVSSLRSDGHAVTDPERAELLATADESLDRLTRLVENLLDMSRLQAGVLGVLPQPVGVWRTSCRGRCDELGRRPVRGVGPRSRPARGDGRPGTAGADPGERRSRNALRYSPAGPAAA